MGQNSNLVKEFIGSFTTGGFEEATKYLADDFVWWMPGDGEVQDRVAGIFKAFSEVLGGPLSMTVGDMTEEGNRVAVEAESYALLKNGSVYNNNYHFLFVIDNGKISKIKEYANSKHAQEVLGPLMGF